MLSLPIRTFDLDAWARAARAAVVVCAATLAGCSGVSQKDNDEGRVTDRAVGMNQQAQWLEEAETEQPPQDIWERMRDGFKLQDEIGVNPRVERQRLWYVSKPSVLESASARGSLYIHYVVERLEERNMPLELALLPVVESAYNPFAYSRSHAVGIWQFIPSTGRYFNLRQTNWYDGRRDITASTNAALNYLERLHEMFNGDWLLALAAYNAGEGTVSRAIERNQKLGLPTDYWNLPLPQETQDYVPKLLALSQLVMAPEAYGVNLSPIANEPYFEVVEVKQQRLDLSQVAELANMDADEMYQLNPAFKKRITMDGPQHLLVPTDKAEMLTANLALMKLQELVDWQQYRVRNGDSLHGIANRYHVTVKTLKEINGLSGNDLRVGQQLSIPVEPGLKPDQPLFQNVASTSSSPATTRIHKVKRGDNLWTVARQYKVDVQDIKRWNKLKGNQLKAGQVLKLQGGATQLASAGKAKGDGRESVTYYKVKQGDSLYLIAKRFNVEMKHLQRWNPRSGGNLKPGQTLTVYLP